MDWTGLIPWTERAALCGLTLSAVMLAAILWLAYTREVEREDRRWRLHVSREATRQESELHPIERSDWKAPSERVV